MRVWQGMGDVPVPAGTYFSRMTAAGHDGRVQQATGRVVVVRP